MDSIAGQREINGLWLTQAQWLLLRAEAERLAPEEACGLLAGQGYEVKAVIPVTNALHSQVRYRMEPTEQFRAFLEIERQGLELIGIYHTHPRGPGEPSPTDKAEAYYPESVYLIISGQVGGWQLRGFFIRDDQTSEIPIHVEN